MVIAEKRSSVTVDGKDAPNPVRPAPDLAHATLPARPGRYRRFCLDDKGGTIVMPKKGAA
jgi:hypothetical protein